MTTPYKAWARQYLALGWSPLPLNLRTKDPVPEGYTGAKAGDRYVTPEEVRAWLQPRAVVHVGKLAYPPGNIALRLPKDIIGLDVDAHSGKAGSATYRRALREWGPLPATWKSSSRPGSPLSGIYLFRVPEGLAWPGNLGKAAKAWGTGGDEGRGGPVTGGVDLIRWDHRYMVVGPSQHDKAPYHEYFWVTPDGRTITLPWKPEDTDTLDVASEFELPAPDEIPDMPDAWVAGLTEGRQWASSGSVGAAGAPTADEVKAWTVTRDRRSVGGAYASGVCPALERTLNRHVAEIRTAGVDGGAHDAARDAVWAVMGDSASGHYGVGKAINRIKGAFLEAVKERRSERQARQEFWRILRDGCGKIINEYTDEDGGETYEEEDPCSQLATAGMGPRGDGTAGNAGGGAGGGGLDEGVGRKGRGSSAFDFKQDDIGNGQRLRRHLGGDETDAIWCGPLGGWHVWQKDDGLWKADPEGIQMLAEAMDMVRAMDREAQYIEDEKMRIKFIGFISKSSNVDKMNAAIKAMRSLRGIAVDGERFDSNLSVLHVANGVVELKMDGTSFRDVRRDDYFRYTTGTRYVPGAQHELWEKFLDRFLPDPGIRKWAQKLAGYSLQGENPARTLVICKGKTSTGKTTFAEALRTALGGYASTFNLSLFRASQDERPRVDVLEALPKRFIMAEEVSSAWHLHADQVKRATGNGMWEARGLFGRGYISRVPAFTPWIATNNTPTIEGSDPALMRRLRNIPFTQQVSQDEEDGLYKAKLRAPEVLEAILAWAVAGWELWLEDESLTDMPPSVLEQLAEIGDTINDFQEMLAEVYDRDATAVTPFDEVYEAYQNWCAVNDVGEKDRLHKNMFGRKLTQSGYGPERATIGGKQHRVRNGIRVKSGVVRLQ